MQEQANDKTQKKRSRPMRTGIVTSDAADKTLRVVVN